MIYDSPLFRTLEVLTSLLAAAAGTYLVFTSSDPSLRMFGNLIVLLVMIFLALDSRISRLHGEAEQFAKDYERERQRLALRLTALEAAVDPKGEE